MSDPHMPEQIRLDAHNLRGIAHPTRLRLLGLLRADGPATATALARRLGMNTGATSYHLRQLGRHGFVVDEPARGNARERWWRAAHWSTTFPDDELFADDTGPGAAFLRAVAHVYADKMFRAIDALPTLPKPWRAAQDFSDYLLTLTPAEAERLGQEIGDVLRRYRTADPQARQEVPEGAARVTFQFQLFPYPGDIGLPVDAAPEAEQ